MDKHTQFKAFVESLAKQDTSETTKAVLEAYEVIMEGKIAQAGAAIAILIGMLGTASPAQAEDMKGKIQELGKYLETYTREHGIAADELNKAEGAIKHRVQTGSLSEKDANKALKVLNNIKEKLMEIDEDPLLDTAPPSPAKKAEMLQKVQQTISPN